MTNPTGIQWLNDNTSILKFIRRLVDELEELQQHKLILNEGELLFSQGEPLEDFYLLLEGKVKLIRTQSDKSEITLINLEAGSFVGLIAFTTGEPTLTSACISEKGLALKMKPQQFEKYLNDHPRLKHPFQQLMLNNMVQRYKSNIRLHTKTHLLNIELHKERNELKKAYQQLEETHQLLVHQEKMATLGELVAGFAHEVNNPASALIRSAENLITLYSSFEESNTSFRLFKIGLNSQPLDSATLRNKMIFIEQEYPWVHERSLIRKLAQMPDEALEIIQSQREKENPESLTNHFEAGKLIHNIQIASNRIANLVKSLKSYSRQEQIKEELFDIRNGIKDTLLVLSNRLKFINLILELNEIPKTCVRVGDLNQVWTNIIVNACDALEDGGDLFISTYTENGAIIIKIADTGPGIKKEHLSKLFEPNFTTKNQGAKFGLGLGLVICKDIIQQAGGSLTVNSQEGKGAEFVVSLPVKTDC